MALFVGAMASFSSFAAENDNTKNTLAQQEQASQAGGLSTLGVKAYQLWQIANENESGRRQKAAQHLVNSIFNQQEIIDRVDSFAAKM